MATDNLRASKDRMPLYTVRHLRQRLRADVLAPAYERCGWRAPEVYQLALQLRRAHAPWGAGLIRVLLREYFDCQAMGLTNRPGIIPRSEPPLSWPGQ